MTAITTVSLDVADPEAAQSFYETAFGVSKYLDFRAAEAGAKSGFRGFTLSLVVAQPNTVDQLVSTALDHGASSIKPAEKSFWGYGGVVRAPDGAIWTVASSSKKNSGPATREIDEFVLQLGVSDVKASKAFYGDRGLPVAKSYGSKYVQFKPSPSQITLALYGHRALAKTAGVSADDRAPSSIVIGTDGATFTDPDGFAWQQDARP